MGCGQGQPRPGHAQRVAKGYGAAIGVYMGGIIREPKLPHDCQSLGSKGFVQFYQIYVRHRQPEPVQKLFAGRCGAYAHNTRGYPGHGGSKDAGYGLEIEAFHRSLRGDDDRRGPIIDARGISGCYRTIFAKRRAEACKLV